MPNDKNKRQEAKHLANINATEKRVKQLFEDTIDSIFEKAGAIGPKGDIFSITDHPVLNTAVNAYLKQFHDTMVVEVENGIKDDWELSRLKHIDIVSSTYQGKELSDTVKRIVYDKHEGALEQFIQARANGLNLSDRVWNYTNQFKSEIEQGLYAGISQGMSAVRMAQEQKKYLREPDKLFRRVRDAGGKLKLSKAAQAYKPGRGVYRSSFKNALRMTRNQNNFAYRTADVLRWQATPFVLGYEVKLSNSHPKYDMCDRLAGKYPVSFIFKAWHISCICYSVPILASPDEFDKYEDAVLNGTADDFEFTGRINDMPAAAKAWIRDNKDKFDGSGPKPFWYKENFVDGDPANGLKAGKKVEEPDELTKRIQYIVDNAYTLDSSGERATIDEHRATIKTLREQTSAMYPTLQEYKKNLQVDKYRELAREYNSMVELMNSLRAEIRILEDNYATRAAELLQGPVRGSAKLTGTRDSKVLKGGELFNMIVGNKTAIEGKALPVAIKAGRAHYSLSKSIIQASPGEAFNTVAHEMGHWLEHKDANYFEQVKAFYKRRTEGERTAKMADLQPGLNYDRKEITKEDKFINPYTGKVYATGMGRANDFDPNNQYATELTSMWFTHALSDLRGFIEKDRDHFEFIYRLFHK